ncbi:glycosyltransferase family 87 protein [Aurantibacillus circumpalustris]|uniref:glycosyltransferase family 87 protein n=1 Tax=Aurantibacillus circumpalustris TaxID=3036359 RepID=UPI00295B857E|nr:glycosyltransferase family 87 protein [Aurantibacillus circumpalustris]
MKRNISATYIPLLFFVIGSLCILFCLNEPIKDFGNYYYGSKLLLDGKFNSEIYTSIHYFNKQIGLYGENNFFENYLSVPPFSALFYIPFCFLKSQGAKVVFNIISLLLFCLSLFRLLKFVEIRHWLLYFLPLVFIYPIYNNISQGQTYLLISAFLIEGFLSSEKGSVFYSSLLFAIVISLKLFPAFILIYFLIKKQFKLVFTTLGLTATLFVLTCLILPQDTTWYYFTDILPRLFNNDVVGTYYYGNQSVYTALLQLFSYDELSNPNPTLNNAHLVILFESLSFTFIIVLVIKFRQQNSFLFYSFTLLAGILLGKYNTSYSMLLLLPLSFSIISSNLQLKYILLFFIFLTVSAPIGSFMNFPFLIRFSRLFGLILIFLLLIVSINIKPDLKTLVYLFVPIFFFKYFTFPIRAVNYFPIQNTKGILYDIVLNNDSITLKSVLGAEDYSETFVLNKKSELKDDLFIKENVIYYKNKVICDSKDNKRNPFLYNGNSIVFMSDLNQGARFYKLRSVRF